MSSQPSPPEMLQRTIARLTLAISFPSSPSSAASGYSAGFRVQGAGCRVQGSGCRVQGAGCRVQGAGLLGR